MRSSGGDARPSRLASAGRRVSCLIAVALVATGCRLPYVPGYTSPRPAAIADLADANGRVVGKAVPLQQRGGVRILIDFSGVAAGTKAVHIHEVGRCEPPSFESAGGHFDPDKAAHGTANPRGPHAGDLPNAVIDETGHGHLEVTATRVSLEKGSGFLFDADGSALVLHERADDMRTDPDGDSGARIACGVIERGE